jgi:transcription initiation factor TFIID subunit 6
MKNIFVLHQMMQATQALLENQAIYLDPYLAYMVPPVLTCCTGRSLGPATQQAPSNASSETLDGNGRNPYRSASLDHFQLRTYAAALLSRICEKGASSNQGLKARIARTCLKQFMDPEKSPGTHFGALRALISITRKEGIQMLVLPNLKAYSDEVLTKNLSNDLTRTDTERVIDLILSALSFVAEAKASQEPNGTTDLEYLRERLSDKVGDLLADRIISKHHTGIAQYLLKANVDL